MSISSVFQFPGLSLIASFFSSAGTTVYNAISDFVNVHLRSNSNTSRGTGEASLNQRGVTQSSTVANNGAEKAKAKPINYFKYHKIRTPKHVVHSANKPSMEGFKIVKSRLSEAATRIADMGQLLETNKLKSLTDDEFFMILDTPDLREKARKNGFFIEELSYRNIKFFNEFMEKVYGKEQLTTYHDTYRSETVYNKMGILGKLAWKSTNN